MKQHIETIKEIINRGDIIHTDRSGSGMYSIIGVMEKYSLVNGDFPLTTTRKINFEKTLHELIWFIKGKDDVTYLKENNVPFWDKWTSPETNTIGPMYPSIWRNYQDIKENKEDDYFTVGNIDQLRDLVNGLRKDINNDTISRRHYISNVNLAYRPEESVSPIDNVNNGLMALDTCHREFFVSLRELGDNEMEEVKRYRQEQEKVFGQKDNRPLPKYKLNTCLTMRSNDVMVGKPHNIAQYACMNFILAHVLNCHPGKHVHQVNDAHIYIPHIESAMLQCSREPFPLPKLYISLDLNEKVLLDGNLTVDMFKLEGYQSHDAIKFSLEG